MKAIPVSAAKHIAKKYGYDQILIYARKVGEAPDPCGEHVTTYGVDKAHCDVAALIGDHFKYKVIGWVEENVVDHTPTQPDTPQRDTAADLGGEDEIEGV